VAREKVLVRRTVQPGAQLQVKAGVPPLSTSAHSDVGPHGELRQAGSTSHKSPLHPSKQLQLYEGILYEVAFPLCVAPT